MTDTMLSGIPQLQVSESMPISETFSQSMTSLLSDNSWDMMNVDKRPLDVEQYMDECIDAGFGLPGVSPALSATSTVGHQSVSRTSSNEETGGVSSSKYTSPASLNSISSVDSCDKDLGLVTASAVTCEDFPYEDVLSLENALKQAVGDTMDDIARNMKSSVSNQPDRSSRGRETSTQPYLGRIMPEVTTRRAPTRPSIPPISNVLPKVSHRVVISPTTTLVLSDDAMRKKHRSISASSQQNRMGIPSGPIHVAIDKRRRTDDNLPEVFPTYEVKRVTTEDKTSAVTEKEIPSYSVVSVSHEPLARKVKPDPVIETHKQSDWPKRRSGQSRSLDVQAISITKRNNFDSSASTLSTSSRARTYDESVEEQQQSIEKVTQSESSDPSTKLPSNQQPLPPEGYKITRYPIQPQRKQDEGEKDEENSEIVDKLRYKLKRAHMEITQCMREVEDWKSTAQHTFDAARKIRAQMELERSRADRAESRISQLTAHFRAKAVARANSLARKSDDSSEASSSIPRDRSPAETYSDGGGKTSEKRRALSDPPIILIRKRRRTVTGVDEAARDLAQWLTSSSPCGAKERRKTTSTPPISPSVSDTLFGASKPKDDLVHAPQINSGVRLALRAKVCSARADTLNTAYDMMKQTQLLVADLPTIPESASSTNLISNLLDDRIAERNRWRSIDSISSRSSAPLATPSEREAQPILSQAVSEPSLEIGKSD